MRTEGKKRSDRIYISIKRVAEALTEDVCDRKSTELYKATVGKQSIYSALLCLIEALQDKD